MHAIAEARGFETGLLLTADATADAVVAGIERAAAELGSGDFFFLTYAGHGGQVPDAHDGDEEDGSDETWVLYDRQLVDDELYALWATFEPGVCIFVLSDSCHSGTVTRNIDASVPNVVASREDAEAQSPRFRAMPRDVMIATYRANRATYDGIQDACPGAEQLEEGGVPATVLLISGCQDDQLSLDGFSNGFFTEQLLRVWEDGAWRGSYPAFHEAIRSRMPDKQQPNYTRVGAAADDFEQQDPLTIG
jgi:metacaspase-1